MSQNSTSRQLQKINVGDTRLKHYYTSHSNIDVNTGNRVVCDLYIPLLTIYKGVVITGWFIAGGGNTANNQHYVVDFTFGIYPYTPTYLMYQDRAISNMKLKIWSNDSDSNLYRFTVDCLSSYKSFTIEYWQHPVDDYYSNPKGIRQGNIRELANMTGWTLRKTGI